LSELSLITLTSRLGCEAALLRSSILKDLGRHDEVIDELVSAWDYFSPKGGCIEIGYQLATEFDAGGRREEGLEIALKLLESNSHDPVALNFVGYIWADEATHLDQAFEMISEALKQRPDDPYILDSMAWVLYRQNRAKEALRYLQKAVEKLDTDPTIHEHMGDVLQSLGKHDRALDHYLKASSLSRNARDELQEKINELVD
jgi:tetratricopeptide (TPR) repeat protein